MKNGITETEALTIVDEFLKELLSAGGEVLALYVIGSLGGGYYRPGQSDIDTVVIVRDGAAVTQEEVDRLAERYQEKYSVPKGFGSVLIHESELLPPYEKSEAEEFEFTVEIARLKIQGRPIYGSIALDKIVMPSREYLIRDALIMERWFTREFGPRMFDKLQITGCVNSVLIYLRRYLMIEKGIFEFNKFKTIDAYLQNDPPIVDEDAFNIIHKCLSGGPSDGETDLRVLRSCGNRLRSCFNSSLLLLDQGEN